MNDVTTDTEQMIFEKLLQAAIEEARQGLAEGGIPIGSALGDAQGQIIARGHNMRVQREDPMAHAEICCLQNAGLLKSFQGLILASTLMPCCLCAGAVVQFRIGTVVVGEGVNFNGEQSLMESRGVRVVNLNSQTCMDMMAEFIRTQPQLWNQDIGV